MRPSFLRGLALAAAFATASTSLAIAQTAGDDMHAAGHDTKKAATNTGHATKKVAKKTAHATKHGAQVTGHDTKVVGEDIGHGTKVGAEKTGHGLKKVGNKITGKDTPPSN